MRVNMTAADLLQRCWVTRVAFAPNPAYQPTGHGPPAVPLDLTACCHIQLGLSRQAVALASLKLRLADERAPTATPYRAAVVTHGVWSRVGPALFDTETLRRLTAGEGLRTLYELAAEAVNSASGDGIHGPLWLPTIDLAALSHALASRSDDGELTVAF